MVMLAAIEMLVVPNVVQVDPSADVEAVNALPVRASFNHTGAV